MQRDPWLRRRREPGDVMKVHGAYQLDENDTVLFDDVPDGMELLEDYFELKVGPGMLVEGKDGKRPYLKGRLGLVEEDTANGRYYPRTVMEREIAKLLEGMKAKKVYGELDHPGDGKTKLSRVSHFVIDAGIKENNEILGALEFIPGTINGDQALAIARAGGTLGVSSRGFGTTIPDRNGRQRVQEDYKLVTWDIVADPANAGAHPDFVMEGKEINMLTLTDVKEKHPDVVKALREELMKELEPVAREHAREALREEFTDRLREEGKTIREEAVRDAKEDLQNDPEVAGAIGVVEQIKELISPYIFKGDENKEIMALREKVTGLEAKLAKQDKELLSVREELEEVSGVAKELGYNLYLEREVGDADQAKHIVSLLGDVKRYSTFDEFKEAVSEVMEALEEEDKERAELEGEIAKLRKQKAKMQESLDQALVIGSQLGVRAYLEKKLGRHPRAAEARSYISEAAPQTKDDVDRLLRLYDRKNPLSEDYKKIRRGLKRLELPKSMKSRGPMVESSQIMGVSLAELKERADRM